MRENQIKNTFSHQNLHLFLNYFCNGHSDFDSWLASYLLRFFRGEGGVFSAYNRHSYWNQLCSSFVILFSFLYLRHYHTAAYNKVWMEDSIIDLHHIPLCIWFPFIELFHDCRQCWTHISYLAQQKTYQWNSNQNCWNAK